MNENSVKQDEKRTYTVEDIQKILCIGKNKAYALAKEGQFKTVIIGNSLRISKKSFDAWLDENNL